MTKPLITIHNSKTGEIVTREFNADELKQLAIEEKAIKAEKAETEAKAVQRQLILDRLGITADEAKLLLG
jgi:hypothetical protein